MNALKLFLAFAPWIAFWIISTGGSILYVQIGIIIAAILVVVMGITKLHRGLILYAGYAFFGFALISVVALKNMWVIHHLGVLAGGTLLSATLISIVIGAPFTESYAREHVPRDLWDSPEFIRSCYTVTGVWSIIFLLNCTLSAIKPAFPEIGEWAFRCLELIFLSSGVAFTTIFSKIMQKKRNEAHEHRTRKVV